MPPDLPSIAHAFGVRPPKPNTLATPLNSCYKSNLNGHYHAGGSATGVNWYTWKGSYYSVKKTEIKFRPAGFQT